MGIRFGGPSVSPRPWRALWTFAGAWALGLALACGGSKEPAAPPTGISPTISRQPYDDVAFVGQTPGFAVAATGSGALTYQWYKNGTALTDGSGVMGATADTCFLPPLTSADDGAAFTVRVSDYNGTTLSEPGHVTITPAASGDTLSVPSATSASYHLDAVSGDDASGDGTSAHPYKTLAKVRSKLHGGELVLLHDGSYDALSIDATAAGDLAAPYTDWVTFMAAPGTAPVVAKANFHGNWFGPESWNGNLEMRVRLIGLTFADGLTIAGCNLVRVEKCVIHRAGAITGSTENMDKRGVLLRGCRSITIEDCEITHTSEGIIARGNDLTIRRNNIHHNSCDGIDLTGCDHVLIEGNQIHDLDDGVDDDVAWSAHVDGIQIYMETDGSPITANRHITLRGNRIYHVESMALMLQNRNDQRYSEGHRDVYIAENWLIENNVFGGTAGFMIHGKFLCKGFVFRHNSVVYIASDQYQVQARTVLSQHYDVSLPTYSDSTGVEVYNNIFCGLDRNWSAIDATYAARYDHNLFYHSTGVAQSQGLNAVVTTEAPFTTPAAFDGALIPTSLAINAASTLAPAPKDLRGYARGAQPDIGAYEYGATP